MRWLSLIVASAIVASGLSVAPAPAMANQREKATKQFEALWNERLAGYRSSAAVTASRHKAASDALLAKAFAFSEGDRRLDDLITSAEADAQNSGKGEELDAFLTHIRSRPSLGLSQAYLQGRVQDVIGKGQEADSASGALTAALKSKTTTYAQLFVLAETAAMTRGEAVGHNDELQLLIANFGSYSADYAAASDRDRDSRARWGAALAAMGRGLATPQQHLTTCTTVGNFVNCSSQ